jgi:hypothetical protein
MNPSKSTAGMMLDVRIILSVLWIARLLSGLQGDTYRLSDPVALQSILANNGAVVVTNELLLIMSIIFVIPTLMSFLTLIFKYPAVRWVNLAIGLFLAVFDLVFLVLALFQWRSTGYEIVWSIAYLVCTTLIVWYAWRWPKQEA